VSFFEIPELDPPKPWRPGAPWKRAPEHELGVDLPLGETLVDRDDLRFMLMGAVAYSTGFTLWLQFLRRPGDLDDVFQSEMDVHVHASQVTEKFLRFGVEFSDGRRATNLDEITRDRRAADSHPPAIYLSGRGHCHGPLGGLTAWISPLPPQGSLGVLTEWPAVGLSLTRTEIQAEPIIEASRRSERFWDDDPQWEDDDE
jgi:hypothetical protein